MRKFLMILFLFITLGYVGVSNKVPDLELNHYAVLNTRNVIMAIGNLGIKHPGIVLSQVKLETGNLQHTYGNNLFGFRTSKHIHFDNWYESVKYYKDWQDKKYDSGDYYKFIKKVGYANDPNYINKLKSIKHNKQEKGLIKYFKDGK